MTLLIVYATVALGISFVCSLLEAVLLSTTRGHVAVLESKGYRWAALWAKYKDDPERPLTAILTLNTIAHTVGALGVGVQVEKLYHGEYALAIASSILTLGILLLSEILPKTIGTVYWKQLSHPVALLLQWLMWLLVWAVVPIEWMRRLFPQVDQETVTRDEFAALAEIGEDEGVLEADEEAVITNLLRLRDIQVCDIMTPVEKMHALHPDLTVGAVMEKHRLLAHSRFPLVLDTEDIPGVTIDGIVLRRKILSMAAQDRFERTLSSIAVPAYTCPPDLSVDAALDQLLTNQTNILIVTEKHTTVGLITMEDVFETLLGVDIEDDPSRSLHTLPSSS